jgi:hypothetical protein
MIENIEVYFFIFWIENVIKLVVMLVSRIEPTNSFLKLLWYPLETNEALVSMNNSHFINITIG